MSRVFFKAVSWVVTSNIVSKIISFGIVSFLARVLNPTGIGMYNAVLTSSASINQICDLGTSIVLQRTGARKDELGKQSAGYRFTIIFLLQLLLNLMLSLGIYFYPALFSKAVLNGTGEEGLVQAIAIIALLQVLTQVPLTFILGLGEFKTYAVRMMIGNLISLGIIISYVIIFDASINQVLNAMIISGIINSLYTLFILRRMLIKFKIPLSLRNIKDESISIFKEGFIYYLGNTFIGAIYNVILLSLFAKYIGIGEFGFVRMAIGLVAILGILPAALQPVTMTFLASQLENEAQLKSLQLRYIAIFSFVATAILIFFVDQAIQILFGDQYLAGKQTFIFIILMNLIILVSSLISNFLVAKGHAAFIGKVSFICAGLNIIICFVLIPRLGLYGFFIGYLVGYGLGFAINLIKEFKYNVYPDYLQLKRLGLFLLIAIIAMFPALFIQNNFNALMYKILYILVMMIFVVPLSIYTNEVEQIMLAIRSKSFNWFKRGPDG